MDKSLKKMSRPELLGLMAQLTEDNEALVAENAQLRQNLAASQRASRSTKVGSIAEAALQANGYFEATQRAADEYLREIKRMRDQLAGRMPAASAVSAQAQSQAQAQAMAQAQAQAQAQARAIVQQANAQAEAILANARAKSEQVIADANRQSHAIIAGANRQADAVLNAARANVTAGSGAVQASMQASAQASGRSAVIGSNTVAAMSSPAVSMPIRGRHVRPA